MRALRTPLPVLAPVALVVVTAIVGAFFERSTEIYFINALVSVSMVVALYVFVGNSGVLSCGHMSFVAIGAGLAALGRAQLGQRDGCRVPGIRYLGRRRCLPLR